MSVKTKLREEKMKETVPSKSGVGRAVRVQ